MFCDSIAPVAPYEAPKSAEATAVAKTNLFILPLFCGEVSALFVSQRQTMDFVPPTTADFHSCACRGRSQANRLPKHLHFHPYSWTNPVDARLPSDSSQRIIPKIGVPCQRGTKMSNGLDRYRCPLKFGRTFERLILLGESSIWERRDASWPLTRVG